MMETVSTSETSVNFYQTTRRLCREDSHLYTRRRENLKSHHKIKFVQQPFVEIPNDQISSESVQVLRVKKYTDGMTDPTSA
jgi:hypothetical protein